jgi:hypothetical protein
MTSSAMRRDERSRRRFEDVQIPLRLKLSALWVATMFLYVYVDVLYFYKPGTIDDILVGRVWEFDISQGWALGALALMTIPILMVFLSLVLPTMAARWSNLLVASLLVLVAIVNVVGETWAFVWFGSAMEAALLLMISRYAWRWPRLVD